MYHSITDKISLNRKILFCINKILGSQAQELEIEANEVKSRIERAVFSVFELYRFLNYYLIKFTKNP